VEPPKNFFKRVLRTTQAAALEITGSSLEPIHQLVEARRCLEVEMAGWGQRKKYSGGVVRDWPAISKRYINGSGESWTFSDIPRWLWSSIERYMMQFEIEIRTPLEPQ